MAVSGILDPAVTQLTGQIRDMAARITQLERNQRSGYNAPNTSIDGGSLTINDASGNPAVVIGAQSDGTFAVKQVGTVVPPLAPSTPVISGGILGVYVAWDGLMNDGTTPLLDFSATQVHVSTTANFIPSSATLVGQMLGQGLFGIGGLTAGTTYYVVLVAVNGAGQAGDPSGQASGIPIAVPAGVPPNGSITGLMIQTGAITSAQLAAAAGILGSQIAGATITSANIFAGTITAALLAANLVVAGIVDATTITGSTLRNSATDPKTEITPDGSILITNAGGVTIFSIGPDGTISWFAPTGTLMMQLQPGGTQLIYASLTGPSGWDFEPPGPPVVLVSASSAVSSTTYVNGLTVSTVPGSTLTVVASASGATDVTGVTDTQGNVYTLIQSVTANQHMQVFQCVNAAVLTNHDSITVTYGAANTQEKNIIVVATAGVLTASVTDFSASANGSGTAVSVSGTPANYGDTMLFFVSDASAGGAPSAVPDGWFQLAQQHVSTFQWTTVYASTNVTGFAQNGTATIATAAWSAVILGLSAAPVMPIGQFAIIGNNTFIAPSTVWAADGQLSLRIMQASTAPNWGVTFPAFPVVPGVPISMQTQIYTPAALASVSIGFTFWTGAGGSGSNLGTVSGDQGTLTTTAGGIYQVSITGASVPAGAQSATFFVREAAADVAGTVYYVDAIQVPGGLVYSNSPLATTDSFGNPVPQGINFVGLPGLTNVLSVTDPFGTKLAGIDGSGNVVGQTVSAAQDVLIGGQSLLGSLVGAPLGLVNYGFFAIGGTAWPTTPIGSTKIALFELDQQVKAGRIYEFVMNPTIINTQNAAIACHLFLHFTTDGSTPTTSSPIACEVASRVEITSTDAHIGPIRCVFFPAADGVYRFLVSGATGSGTFQFKNDPNVRCQVYDWGLNTGVGNNNSLVAFGTGASGGNSPQTYTEYFYGNNTWSYWSNGTQRTHNGTIYQGAYQGDGGTEYCYIQFSTGSLGNALNTVLNYSVNYVTFRLTNMHSWYNNGMTVSFHSATVVNGTASLELQNWFISEGNTYAVTLIPSAWAPFKAGGTTYAVLRAPAGHTTDLAYYGYFWGGGATGPKTPLLTVNYTH